VVADFFRSQGYNLTLSKQEAQNSIRNRVPNTIMVYTSGVSETGESHYQGLSPKSANATRKSQRRNSSQRRKSNDRKAALREQEVENDRLFQLMMQRETDAELAEQVGRFGSMAFAKKSRSESSQRRKSDERRAALKEQEVENDRLFRLMMQSESDAELAQQVGRYGSMAFNTRRRSVRPLSRPTRSPIQAKRSPIQARRSPIQTRKSPIRAKGRDSLADALAMIEAAHN
jgi:hypothetical protein